MPHSVLQTTTDEVPTGREFKFNQDWAGSARDCARPCSYESNQASPPRLRLIAFVSIRRHRPRTAPLGLASPYPHRLHPALDLVAPAPRLNWTLDWSAALDTNYLDPSRPCFPSVLDLCLPLLPLLDLDSTFRSPLYSPSPS